MVHKNLHLVPTLQKWWKGEGTNQESKNDHLSLCIKKQGSISSKAVAENPFLESHALHNYLGKVVEHVVTFQFQGFPDLTNYLDQLQSGFRPQYI